MRIFRWASARHCPVSRTGFGFFSPSLRHFLQRSHCAQSSIPSLPSSCGAVAGGGQVVRVHCYALSPRAVLPWQLSRRAQLCRGHVYAQVGSSLQCRSSYKLGLSRSLARSAQFLFPWYVYILVCRILSPGSFCRSSRARWSIRDTFWECHSPLLHYTEVLFILHWGRLRWALASLLV